MLISVNKSNDCSLYSLPSSAVLIIPLGDILFHWQEDILVKLNTSLAYMTTDSSTNFCTDLNVLSFLAIISQQKPDCYIWVLYTHIQQAGGGLAHPHPVFVCISH